MVVLTPKSGLRIPLHTKFLLIKYFKSSNYQRKTQYSRIQASTVGVGLAQCQKLSGLHSKPRFQNSHCYSKPVAVICIYFPLQLSKSFQVPFNPFSDSCLSKMRVKTCDKEPQIWELQAVSIKFRNKWVPYHQLKIAIAQNYEREINLIQREYMLT